MNCMKRLFRRHSKCPPKILGDLREVLLRERSRADRTESEFCLVWFPAFQMQDKKLVAQLLDEKLRRRTRLTDYVGHHSEGSVWLVLVDCSSESCRKIVQEVLESESDLLGDLLPTIYHYPGELSDIDDSFPDDWSWQSRPSLEPNRHAELGARSVADGVFTNRLKIQAIGPLLEVPMPIGKRFMDVGLSSFGLLLFLPFFLLISWLIRWESAGPAIFVQRRLGRGNRVFKMYKFRTMVINAEQIQRELRAFNEQDGPAFKMKKDPRVTRMGYLLRATSLDEVPQLWNVLRGEMSLVGPRPLPVAESVRCERWQRHRESITPGLTCFWQVQERRNSMLFDEWVRLDLRYIREFTFVGDLKLLFSTLLVAFRARGI